MKTYGLTWKKMICGLLLIILFIVPACSAAGELMSDPTTLSYFFYKGENATRTVYLKNTDPALNATNLSVTKSDLITKDSMKYLRATAITTDIQPDVLGPKGYLTFPVTVDSGTAESGSYTGNLIINSNLSSLTMPVTVTIKEPPLLPLIVLVVSTLFSVAFFDYATRGEKSARLKIKIHDLNNKLLNEQYFRSVPSGDQNGYNMLQFTEHFLEPIKNSLSEAEENLKNATSEDMKVAEAGYTEAYTAWDNWISNRVIWKDCLERTKKIFENLEKLSKTVKDDLNGQDFAFPSPIKDELHSAWWDAADPSQKKTPTDLLKKILTLGDLVSRFSDIYHSIKTDCDGPGDGENEAIKKLCAKTRDQLLQTPFKNIDDLNKVYDNFERNRDSITPATRGRSAHGVSSVASIGELIGKEGAGYESRKTVGEEEVTKEGVWIDPIKTWWARYVTPVAEIWPELSLVVYDQLRALWIPAILLIILGYSQLYESNLTFGANVIGDYSTLVIWGFATGPASDSIVTIIKDKTTTKAT
jgi:hypothetical protein